jgi:RNA polymerase sigma-70 factor, ECF subfamily
LGNLPCRQSRQSVRKENTLADWLKRSFQVIGRMPGGEAELIQAAQSGEEKAFEQLFHQHKDRVFSLCLRLTGNYHEAEDMAQESFVLAFRRIADFRGESMFGTWLYRITVRVVIDALRKKRPQLVEPFNEDFPVAERPSRKGISEAQDLTIERLQLERAIARLPDGYKAVLVLHDIEGHSHEEIAEMLGFNPGTCKSQLHKARRKLRELLIGS